MYLDRDLLKDKYTGSIYDINVTGVEVPVLLLRLTFIGADGIRKKVSKTIEISGKLICDLNKGGNFLLFERYRLDRSAAYPNTRSNALLSNVPEGVD